MTDSFYQPVSHPFAYPPTKEMAIDAPVSIALPAFVWWGLMSAYRADSGFVCWELNQLCREIQEALLSPAFVKEQEAQQLAEREQGPQILRTILTGESPEVPPHWQEPA